MKRQLTREQWHTIREDFEAWDPTGEARLRSNYGGRGMYGATCVGVVHSDASMPAAFLYFLATELGEDFLDLLADLGGGSRDSMGLDTISYWRGLTVEGDEEDPDED